MHTHNLRWWAALHGEEQHTWDMPRMVQQHGEARTVTPAEMPQGLQLANQPSQGNAMMSFLSQFLAQQQEQNRMTGLMMEQQMGIVRHLMARGGLWEFQNH